MNNKCIHRLNIQTFSYCKECSNPICQQCNPKHDHYQSLIPLDAYFNHLKASFNLLPNQIDNITIFQSLYNNIETLKESLANFSLKLDECHKAIGALTMVSNTSLASIVLNAKDTLNSFRFFSETNESYPNDLIELSKRAKDSLNITKNTDRVVEQFNLDLSDFSIGLNMIVKYSQEHQISIENYYLINNSHINDFINEKAKEDNSELRQRIELLEMENRKLYQMKSDTSSLEVNEKSHQPKQAIKSSSLIDYSKDERDIIALVQQGIVNNLINHTHYEILKQYDLRSIVTMSFLQLNNLIKLKEIDETHYASEDDFISTFFNKGISDHIYQSSLFKSYIDSLIDVIKCEMMHYIFSIKTKVFPGLDTTLIHAYLKSSYEMKKLKAIDLKGIGLTESNMYRVALVANCTNATELYLQNNKIRDSGVRILFASLEEGNKLKNIYLNNNALTKTALSYFKEALSFKADAFRNLKIITFENNSITNDKANKELLFEIRQMIKSTIHI